MFNPRTQVITNETLKNKFEMMLAERSNIPVDPHQKSLVRQFQLIDFIYSDFISQIEIKNPHITLHCSESGNLGDIGHLMNCAHAIKTFRPNYEIELLIELKTLKEATIRNIFSMDQYKVTFINSFNFNYDEKENKIKQAILSGCVIGISAGITSAQFHQSHHRTILEYGFEWMIREYEMSSMLSMGLNKTEEGILIPKVNSGSINDTQPWIRAALQRSKHFYHFHQRSWQMQMTSLYTLAVMEEKNNEPIIVVMPGLISSLEDLIKWDMLNKQFLASHGIAKITRVTVANEETILTGNDNGKEMIVISGDIPKHQMEAIQSASQDLFGCAGDVSFSECTALGKLPFYDIYQHKYLFFQSVQKFAEEHHLMLLAEYFNLFLRHFDRVNQTYSDFPRPKGFYAPEVSYDVKNENSVPRKSVPLLKEFNEETAIKIAKLVSNPNLLVEASRFSEFVKERRNFTPRFLSIVDHGIILTNHPELLDVDASLWMRFSKNELSLPDVFEALQAALKGYSQIESYKRNNLDP